MTQGFTSIVDDEDFIRTSAFRWYPVRQENRCYSCTRIKQKDGNFKTILLHRMIMGASKGEIIDHMNGNGLDCRRANLRSATLSQNAANMHNRRPSRTSPFRGVYKYPYVSRPRRKIKKWFAKITVDGKTMNLGSFGSKIKAAKAYDAAARKFFGGFANLNFPSKKNKFFPIDKKSNTGYTLRRKHNKEKGNMMNPKADIREGKSEARMA